MLLDHIAIISSSKQSIEFYKKLGFKVISTQIRDKSHDILVYMSDGLTTLEIYIDATHPARVNKPEALGLRHLGFRVEKIIEFADAWNTEIKTDEKGRFIFIYDPDGLPIEIREIVHKHENK